MKKKQKNKQKNNLIIAIVGVIAVVLIIAGSTYAYWSWETATNQQTSVSVTVRGAEMTIVGNNVSSNTLRPTNDCDGAAAVYGEATVTVTNYTATGMTATPRLNVTLTSQHGAFDTTASNPDLKHLHWALVDTTSTTSKTCANPDYQGTFNAIDKVTVTGGGSTDVSISGPTKSTVTSGTMATFNITNMTNSSTTDFSPSKYTTSSTLEFNVGAATTNQQGVTTETVVTKKYRVYVWLDDTYTHTNVGNAVSDPMQDLSVVVQWSNKSTLVQN